jgi:hypothetical protein
MYKEEIRMFGDAMLYARIGIPKTEKRKIAVRRQEERSWFTGPGAGYTPIKQSRCSKG